MPIVKRVKPPFGPDGEPAGDPATHYVRALGPGGTVAALTKNKAEACEVTAEQFEAVKAAHAGKPLAGKFFLEGDKGRPAPPAAPPAAPQG